MNSSTKRALVSVSDKSQLAVFASGLTQLAYEILSTGGTYRFLHEHNIPVVEVSAYTEFPEIMGGRVKTLHPKIHGAILGRPDQPDDAVAIKEQGIKPFDLVVCNLYPFEQTIAKPRSFVASPAPIDLRQVKYLGYRKPGGCPPFDAVNLLPFTLKKPIRSITPRPPTRRR